MTTPVVRRPRKPRKPRPPARTAHGLHVTRMVWLYVTAHPHATVREITAHLALSSTSVAGYHLRKLVHAGVIDQDRGISRGRRIVVPYMAVPVYRAEAVHGT